MLRSHQRESEHALYRLAEKSLKNAIFELDIMLGRISANGVAPSTPSGQEPDNNIGFRLPSEASGRYALQPAQGLCTGDLDFGLALNVTYLELPFDFQFGPRALMIC
jgi:hypothetical protein